MKKWIFCILMCLLAGFLLLPVSAGGTYIFDDSEILTREEKAELEQQAADISEAYGCGVYFISMDDFHDTGDENAYEAAKTLFKDWNLGLGKDDSGVLLLMSMDNRKMALIAHGYGNAAITDRKNEEIRRVIKESFQDNDWYQGISDYIYETGLAIRYASENDITEEDTVVYTEAPEGFGSWPSSSALAFR